jgi:integrase
MALYERPGSPYYWSKLYHEGKVVRFSTGERTKVAALRKERTRASELETQSKLEGRYSMATLAAKFMIWKQADGRADDSIAIYKKHLRLHILPYFGAETDVRTVTVSQLEDFKAARMAKVSASTVCKELSTLRQLLDYAATTHKLMPQAPRVRNPRIASDPKWRLLTPDELDALLGALKMCRGRGRDAFAYYLFMANTGLRGGSMARLTWEMIAADGRTAHLPSRATKQRKPHVVPLNSMAQYALGLVRARLGQQVGRVFPCRNYRDSMRKAWAVAKLGRVRPHDLRHTFGSLLHAAGRSGPEIRDILGHVTLTMANHYAHTYQAHLHDAVASVLVGAASVPASVPLVAPSVPENARIQPNTENATRSKLVAV